MKKISQHDVEMELIAITHQLLVESGEPSKRPIKMNASLQRHLGIDSLTRAELFQRVEKSFEVTLPDQLLAQAETLNDIAIFLSQVDVNVKEPIRQQVIASHGSRVMIDPSPAKTLVETLLRYAELAPTKPHVYFQDENRQEHMITYGDLLDASLRVAQGLVSRGLRPRETVAIMQPTQLGFFYSFFGVLLAGGVPVPIYPPFRMHMLEAYAKTEARILQNAEVRMLITFDAAEVLGRLLKGFVPSLKEVMTVDDLMGQEKLVDIAHPHPSDPAFIQYTSGSTSDPKGVLLSHYNLISNLSAYGKNAKLTPDDVAVSWLPLYHDFGLIGAWLGSLYHGVPLVLMTPFSFLNHPERWLWAIHYHRATISGGPNFAYELCYRKLEPSQLEGLDLSSWRVSANGAEKVYPRTLENFNKKFAPYGLKSTVMMPVYGLAESTVCLAMPPLEREFVVDRIDRDHFETKKMAMPSDQPSALAFVGCGMAIADHEIKIVDEMGETLPDRSVGSLYFRGPSNMQGYYNNKTATSAVYHDGWIDSGDLAYMVDGEVFITGRRKDLIIKAGRNLYPAEIEELVGAIPGVRLGCVASFAVETTNHVTEELVIVAETKTKDKSNREKIISAIREVISSALDMTPDHIVLVAPRVVPKTSSGKLQRAACKKMYLEGKLGNYRAPAWMQMVNLSVMWGVKKIMAGAGVLLRFIYSSYILLLLLAAFPFVYGMMRWGSDQLAAKVLHHASRWLLRFSFCPLQVTDSHYLKEKIPVIFAANHSSYIDAVIALALAPPGTRFVVKKEVFAVPVLSTMLKKINCISLDRTDIAKGLEDTLQVEAALRAGHSVFVFPEGTFGYAKGLRPFRLGVFKIAAEMNVSVCPIAISGARAVLRDEDKLLKPSRIDITIAKPIAPQGPEWKEVTALRARTREVIAAHCGEPTLDLIAAEVVAPRPPA